MGRKLTCKMNFEETKQHIITLALTRVSKLLLFMGFSCSLYLLQLYHKLHSEFLVVCLVCHQQQLSRCQAMYSHRGVLTINVDAEPLARPLDQLAQARQEAPRWR